jgi:predicted permease
VSAPPSSGGRGPIRWLHLLALRRPPPDMAADWEIEHHLSEATERLMREGWDAAEARREAERQFGSVERYRGRLSRAEREMSLTLRLGELVHGASGGLAAAARTVRREPGFALAVVVTLGLGIGANATMYAMVDRLLLRPPEHIHAPEQVRRVAVQRGEWGGSTLPFTEYLDLLDHPGVEAAAAYSFRRDLTRDGGEDATRVTAVLATASLFPLTGVEPVLGRVYRAEEDRIGAQGTAVLGWEYWRRAFGSDPEVLGRTLELGGGPFTIVGVLPAGFTGIGLAPVDVWLPVDAAESMFRGAEVWRSLRESRGSYFMQAVVRLVPGTSVEAAEVEATAVHRNVRRDDIEQGRYAEDASVRFEPLILAQGSEASAESKVARWLLGVSLVVLLVACANVANLLLARGARRRREVAVRLALGISRKRLLGEAVSESVLLALAGGAAALLLARTGGDALRRVLLPEVLFPAGAVDARVAIYALVVAVVAGLLAGGAPAWQATRTAVALDLGEGGRGGSARRLGFRSALSVAQAAGCVVLLVGAGLFARSVAQVRALDLGIDVDRVIMARIEWNAGVPAAERDALYREAEARLASLPGVAATATTSVEFGFAMGGSIHVPGLDSIPRLPGGGPYFYGVSPGYFRALGLAILEGREIEETDGPGSPPVVVVGRTMAATLWPGESALGRCVILRGSEECTTVVGVVQEATRFGISDSELVYMAYYVPAAQDPSSLRALYVRTQGSPRALVEPVSSFLQALSPAVRYANVQTLRERLDPQARSWVLGATLLSLFGALALLVAAVGLYSVLAFDVAQRTRELGIRAALGAEAGPLLRAVLLRGMRLVALGVAVGLAVVWIAAPHIGDLLFAVSPRDLTVLVTVPLVLLAVAALASLVPALRATRVDPVVALRAE